VICPAGNIKIITATARGGRASFRPWRAGCPLRSACTAARRGRTIAIHPLEDVLQRARQEQKEPAWQERYRAERPIVERKISHLNPPGLGAAAKHAPAGWPASAPASTPVSAPSTGPGSPSSAPATTEPAGQSGKPENQAGPRPARSPPTRPPSTSSTRQHPRLSRKPNTAS
jgi:Transposase DDE domain